MLVFGSPAKVSTRVFVTGSPRSGTTFVGKVLAAAPCVDYIHEPFNPDCGMSGISSRYLTAAGVDWKAFEGALRNYSFSLKTAYYPRDSWWLRIGKRIFGSRGPFYCRLARLNLGRKAVLIKDPIGVLLTKTLKEEWGFKTIAMVRHPLACIGSLVRQQWDLGDHYVELKQQVERCEEFSLVRNRMPRMIPQSDLERAAWIWCAINGVLSVYTSLKLGVLVQRYEAIREKPEDAFRSMYKYAGLPWSTWTSVRINFSANTGVDGRGQQLDQDSRRRVFDWTYEIAREWYPEESFRLGRGCVR